MSYTPLPIGVDDFEEIIEKEYYYVDKSMLIKELLEKKGKVNLFTRPRRFGKTLNLSMLRYYFEIPIDGKDC
ncbi:MAG: AAA family ATPase, partial [Lachnospiraceae bacterium]|nr:AAA family ATPase [Lachnospiraceae bacterium]